MKKFKIKAIASYLELSTKELAEKSNINYTHLCNVMRGKAKMSADDLVKLKNISGFDFEEISIEQK